MRSTLNDIFIAVVVQWLLPDLPHTEVLFSNSVVKYWELDHHLSKEVDAGKAEKSPLNGINHFPLLRSSLLILLLFLSRFIFFRCFIQLFDFVFFLSHFFFKLCNSTLELDVIVAFYLLSLTTFYIFFKCQNLIIYVFFLLIMVKFSLREDFSTILHSWNDDQDIHESKVRPSNSGHHHYTEDKEDVTSQIH